MSMELRWLVSQSASALHVVDAIQRGLPIADATLADALHEPAQALLRDLQNASLPVHRVLRYLVGLAAGIHNDRELAHVALSKVLGRLPADASQVTALAGRIRDVEQALRRVHPNLVDELALRSGPLREQWEARGPGLLKAIARLTDERLIAPSADVVLIHPALGGGGAAHLFNNSVCLEAVLVNPEPQLPEVVRLAWFLSQLNNDLPIFGENVQADRLEYIAPLAMLPALLAAGEVVELTRCDLPTLTTTIRAWHIDVPPDINLAEVLLSWWETYLETRPRWELGLRALDQMIET